MKLYIVWNVYFEEDSRRYRTEARRSIASIWFSEEEALRVRKELCKKHCFGYESELEEVWTEDQPDLEDVQKCIQYYSEI